MSGKTPEWGNLQTCLYLTWKKKTWPCSHQIWSHVRSAMTVAQLSSSHTNYKFCMVSTRKAAEKKVVCLAKLNFYFVWYKSFTHTHYFKLANCSFVWNLLNLTHSKWNHIHFVLKKKKRSWSDGMLTTPISFFFGCEQYFISTGWEGSWIPVTAGSLTSIPDKITTSCLAN